jgi:hypothetical protein
LRGLLNDLHRLQPWRLTTAAAVHRFLLTMHARDEFSPAEYALITLDSLPRPNGSSSGFWTAKGSQQSSSRVLPGLSSGDSLGHPADVTLPGFRPRTSKCSKATVDVLPLNGSLSKESPMTAPGIVGKLSKRVHHSRLQRIEVDVPDNRSQVRILFDENGLISILKEVPSTVPVAVEFLSVPQQQPLHNPGQWLLSSSHQQMEMVGHQAPRKTVRFGCGEQCSEFLEKTCAIEFIREDLAPCNTTGDDVMDGSGSVEAGLSRHEPS